MPHFNIQQHLWYQKLPIYCPRELCTWVGSIPPEPIPPIIPQYNKEQALLESNTSNMWWTIPPRLPIMWVPFQCYGRRLVGGHLPCHRNPSRHDNTWLSTARGRLVPTPAESEYIGAPYIFRFKCPSITLKVGAAQIPPMSDFAGFRRYPIKLCWGNSLHWWTVTRQPCDLHKM